MKKMFIASLALSTFLYGCASTPFDTKTGTEITQAQLSQFVVGKASQSQVVASVGHPNRKEAVANEEIWYYDYNKMHAFFGSFVSEATVFEWDASGKLLEAYKTNQSNKTGNALLDAATGNK